MTSAIITGSLHCDELNSLLNPRISLSSFCSSRSTFSYDTFYASFERGKVIAILACLLENVARGHLLALDFLSDEFNAILDALQIFPPDLSLWFRFRHRLSLLERFYYISISKFCNVCLATPPPSPPAQRFAGRRFSNPAKNCPV